MVGVGTIAIPNGDITAAQRSNEEGFQSRYHSSQQHFNNEIVLKQGEHAHFSYSLYL